MDTRKSADGREREWQFEADDLDSVHRWLTAQPFLPDVSIVEGDESTLSDRYFDTVAKAVFNAGYALRIRDRGGNAEATMKSTRSGSGALRVREEINEPLPGIDPALLTTSTGPVAGKAREISGGDELAPFLEVRTRRRTLLVTAGKSVLAEIALDRTVFPGAVGKDHAGLLRVEVEIADGREESLAPLVEMLREGCSLRPATMSKLEAGLKATGA